MTTRQVTDGQGRFELDNVPFNNYHLTVTAAGFQVRVEDVAVRTPVPLEVKAQLQLGTASTTVNVEEAGDLIETVSDHAHRCRPGAVRQAAAGEPVLVAQFAGDAGSTPGIAADSNGLFHGLGDHASNSFSLDGQPITDQQSKVFSNQIPLDAVQSMEVIEGAPPAEYGDKTSVVIVVTTRSGLGATTPHGDVTASYGSFGTTNGGFDFLARRQDLGQLHLRQWHEYRPVSGWAGIRRHARSRQRRELSSTASTSSLPRPTPST